MAAVDLTEVSCSSLLRGKGPLKNTSDVISAAKKIAEAGSRMDKLGRTIADNVSSYPSSTSALVTPIYN